jgi:ribosome-associated translation inhibitor RaiA
MTVRTHFHHVNVPPAFDDRLGEWLTHKLSKWADVDDLEIEAYLITSAPRRETHGATYECHMTAKAPWLRKTIVIKASNTDFWTLLYDCVHKTKQQIQKLTATRRTRRRRERRESVIAV